MAFKETEDALVWWCEGEGCDAVMAFERDPIPGHFMACVGELKDRGWRIWRSRDDEWGEWHHKCPKCRKATGEGAQLLDLTTKQARRLG